MKKEKRWLAAILSVVVCINAFAAKGRGHDEKPARAPGEHVRMPDRGDPIVSGAAKFPEEYRSVDGAGNNESNSEWGSADIPLLRVASVAYADRASDPAGKDRPSAREVSNAVSAYSGDALSGQGLTDMFWQWGQFLDHDIDLTPTIDPAEAFDIEVPIGDSYFDPYFTGTQVIPLDRSFYEIVDGVREQLNEITAFIDGSNVYGSDEVRADALREMDGSGRLKTSDGDLLPYNVDGFPNAPSAFLSGFFLAGDFRANEQIGLLAMHTLFVREHNYWADRFRNERPEVSGDDVYQYARAMVVAELQKITYEDFLPLLLGRSALPRYSGYKAEVNPGIANEFSTAAYRFGHSMLSSQLLRVDSIRPVSVNTIELQSAFFTPSEIEEHGIDSILLGLCAQQAQEIDNEVVDDVRNFLFGPPGAGGFDLAALNIQRGRDHGLPSYTKTKADLGLAVPSAFSDLTSDSVLAGKLEEVYVSVDDVDLWVGGLVEDKLDDAAVGETMAAIIRDQFLRLRDGDRFWYQSYLPSEMLTLLKKESLASILQRHIKPREAIGDNVFLVPLE